MAWANITHHLDFNDSTSATRSRLVVLTICCFVTRCVCGPVASLRLRDPDLTSLNNGFSSLIENLQSADVAPTAATVSAAAELQKTLAKLLQDWGDLKSKDVAAVNDQLRTANQPLLVP